MTPEGQTPPRRGVGHPSVVAQYAPQLAQWLREDPDLAGAELLRRVRLSGYRDGQSALYEFVRRLRASTIGTEGSLGPVPVPEVTRP